MRLTGKVTEFNRSTGVGCIASKEAGGRVKFHISQVTGGNGKLDAGDFAEFELGSVDGETQATAVAVVSRALALQQRALKAQAGKAIEVQTNPPAQMKSPPAVASAFTSAALPSFWASVVPDEAATPIEN